MRLRSYMNRRQYQAAAMAGIEAIGATEIIRDQKNQQWTIHWNDEDTTKILDRLREKQPAHEMISIPYQTLRARMIVIHRNRKPEAPRAN